MKQITIFLLIKINNQESKHHKFFKQFLQLSLNIYIGKIKKNPNNSNYFPINFIKKNNSNRIKYIQTE